jgi:AmmeMemoRadiSam system protein A
MRNHLTVIAIGAIATTMRDGTRDAPGLTGLPAELIEPGASFVTLERDSRLLGCIGTLEPRRPLAIDIAEHARGAAFDDPRVPPITADDFERMTVKVSVLSPSVAISARDFAELTRAVRNGVDGLTVQAGTRRATFLPSVWAKVRDVDDFLDALWLKAGLRPRSWPPGLRVSRYTTVEVTDSGPRAFESLRS